MGKKLFRSKLFGKLFRKPILTMQPYEAPLEGRRGKDLLADFNERTGPPHPLVLEEIGKYVEEGNLQMYPEYGDLNEALGKYIGVDPQELIPTVGGDQGIDIVFRALVKDKDKVIIPKPTFAMFEQSAHIQGANIISPRYGGSNLDFPFDEVVKKIKRGVKLVVICNPNNPTGAPVPREQTEYIIKKAASLDIGVLVDEAYHEFAPELTVLDLIGKYPNIFIIRTFAKTLGIPSLRAGIVVSNEGNIEQLNKIRGPYDVNMVSVAAMKAMRHPEVIADIKAYVSEVMTVSKPMIEAFYDEMGVNYYPSSAGFHLLVFPNERARDEFVNGLKDRKILVRPRSDPPHTVRASIGTRENTERYITALRDFIQQNK